MRKFNRMNRMDRMENENAGQFPVFRTRWFLYLQKEDSPGQRHSGQTYHANDDNRGDGCELQFPFVFGEGHDYQFFKPGALSHPLSRQCFAVKSTAQAAPMAAPMPNCIRQSRKPGHKKNLNKLSWSRTCIPSPRASLCARYSSLAIADWPPQAHKPPPIPAKRRVRNTRAKIF
jgi:hypothetical protein